MLKLGLSTLDSGIAANSNGSDAAAVRPSSSLTAGAVATSMRLQMRDLTISSNSRTHKCIRQLAYYKFQAVVLEWRPASQLNSGTIERRVDKVAAFLHELEPSFHSLPCRGYVKDHELNRYGYVFSLPEVLQPALDAAASNLTPLSPSSGIPHMRSLYDILGDEAIMRPSLNLRMSIAKTLVETLLNLHTAGWFHKELRSANMILIQRNDRSANQQTRLSDFSVYVAGYIYARSQDHGEMTEPLHSDVEADIYRHPSSLGCSRLPFHKNFDIFTVACVLLEIGLWKRLRDVLEQEMSSKLHTSNKGESSTNGNVAAALKDPQTQHAVDKQGSDKQGSKSSIDLMALRQDLLLSQLTAGKTVSSGKERACKSLRLLDAAVGTTYTDLVEELLFVTLAKKTPAGDTSGKENTLNLELKARTTIQRIYNAI